MQKSKKKVPEPLKEKDLKNESGSRQAANTSSILEFIYIFIGSIPSITVMVLVASIFRKEYILNNYNFLLQNKLLSNVVQFDYFENVTCSENDYKNDRINFKQCAPSFCARFFSDFIVTDEEVKTLLK